MNQVAKSVARVASYLRKGTAQTAPVHGIYFKEGQAGKRCGACAVGTVIAGGIGLAKALRLYDPGWSNFIGWVNDMCPEVTVACPEADCQQRRNRVYAVGILCDHLFEVHEWSRGRIARFLEKKAAELDA